MTREKEAFEQLKKDLADRKSGVMALTRILENLATFKNKKGEFIMYNRLDSALDTLKISLNRSQIVNRDNPAETERWWYCETGETGVYMPDEAFEVDRDTGRLVVNVPCIETLRNQIQTSVEKLQNAVDNWESLAAQKKALIAQIDAFNEAQAHRSLRIDLDWARRF